MVFFVVIPLTWKSLNLSSSCFDKSKSVVFIHQYNCKQSLVHKQEMAVSYKFQTDYRSHMILHWSICPEAVTINTICSANVSCNVPAIKILLQASCKYHLLCKSFLRCSCDQDFTLKVFCKLAANTFYYERVSCNVPAINIKG